MHGRSMFGRPRLQGAGMGIESGKRWEQRWVDIDEAPGIAMDKGGSKDPEKAGESDDVRFITVEGSGKRLIKKRARGVALVIDDRLRERLGAGIEQSRGVGLVADDTDDLVPLGIGCGMKRCEIAASAGNDHRDPKSLA